MPVAIDFFALGNIVIDDIVLADGRTMMGTLGGASPHALAGARVWGPARLGCAAIVGDDLDPGLGAALDAVGIDRRGVIVRPGRPTTRCWQLIEADGRRQEVFRTSLADCLRDAAQFEHLPPDYIQARGAHLYWAPSPEEAPDLVRRLRRANPGLCLVWEPGFQWHRCPPGTLEASAAQADLVSPDHVMACAMTGRPTVEAALDVYLAWGAPLVAIRMGADGSLVGASSGQRWRIPAVAPCLVDVTGAGNAYCGGFMVALSQGAPPLEAALRAAVSASFALEQFGLPAIDARTPAEAQRRLESARARLL